MTITVKLPFVKREVRSKKTKRVGIRFVSLNDVKNRSFDRVYSLVRERYHKEYTNILSEFDKPSDPYKRCRIKYTPFISDNRRRDADNVVLVQKFFHDCLVLNGFIEDDSMDKLKFAWNFQEPSDEDYVLAEIEFME